MVFRKIVLLVLLLSSNVAVAQDWNAWAYSFEFKLNLPENTLENYTLQFFINEELAFNEYRDSFVEYDKATKRCVLKVVYGCISCGYNKSEQPPEIYIKINKHDFFTKTAYSIFIPVYFQKSKSFAFIEPHLQSYNAAESFDSKPVNLGTLDLHDFIEPKVHPSGNKVIPPPYEIFEISAEGTAKPRKKNEYQFRKMNRLIEVPFKK